MYHAVFTSILILSFSFIHCWLLFFLSCREVNCKGKAMIFPWVGASQDHVVGQCGKECWTRWTISLFMFMKCSNPKYWGCYTSRTVTNKGYVVFPEMEIQSLFRWQDLPCWSPNELACLVELHTQNVFYKLWPPEVVPVVLPIITFLLQECCCFKSLLLGSILNSVYLLINFHADSEETVCCQRKN